MSCSFLQFLGAVDYVDCPARMGSTSVADGHTTVDGDYISNARIPNGDGMTLPHAIRWMEEILHQLIGGLSHYL